MSTLRCPVAGCNRKLVPCGTLFRCAMGHLSDGKPDEGGDYHTDPTKRIEREDELRAAKRDNLGRRELAAKGFRMPGRK